MRTINVYDLKLATRQFVEKYLEHTVGKTFPSSMLKVRWQGGTAYVAYDGPRALINFPALPDMTFVSRGEADRIVGFALHECGHIDCTDMTAFEQAARSHGEFFKQLVNGLEDPRMEHVQLEERRAANARPIFNDLLAWLLLDIDKGKRFNPNDPRNMPFTLAVLGRQHLDGYQHEALNRIRQRIKPEWQGWYDTALSGLSLCHSTNDVIALALRLWQQLKQQLPDQKSKENQPEQKSKQPKSQQPSQPEPGDGEQDDEDQDETGEGGGSGESDEQSEKEPDNKAGGKGEKKEDDQDATDQNGDGTDGEQDDDMPTSADELEQAAKNGKVKQPEPDQLMEELAEKITDRASKEAAYKDDPDGAGRSQPDVDGITFDDVSDNPDPSAWQNALLQVPTGQGQLRQYLWHVLRSPEVGGWDNRRPAGRFDRRAFGRLLSGSERVFQTRWLTPGIETAVTVLIDMSSSMNDDRHGRRNAGVRKIDVTQTMTVMLTQIFEQARVKYEVIGFQTGNGVPTQLPEVKPFRGGASVGNKPEDSRNTNYTTCHIRVVKRFDQKLAQARGAIGRINMMARGRTPDYDAMRTAIDRLVQVKANRKVLFVLTDGDGQHRTPDACRFAEFKGIDVIGIGLMHTVKGQYKLSIDVNRAEDLTGSAMRLLVQQINRYVAGRRVA